MGGRGIEGEKTEENGQTRSGRVSASVERGGKKGEKRKRKSKGGRRRQREDKEKRKRLRHRRKGKRRKEKT